ncbi:MAG: DUF1566 domain-containing protein [Turneriella sp.]
MSKKIKNLLVIFLVFLGACQQGFERFAPPANSISGRGAKQNPKIVSTTPANGGTISPVTDVNGTQIRVVFDMTMRVDTNPVLNTFVRDDATSGGWIRVANSGYTWTWSSTTFANDTLTINLGWVRWPENNVIAFDFCSSPTAAEVDCKNESLLNLDDMPLANDGRLSFTVSWNPGRYKVVPTGQESCYFYSANQDKWIERLGCLEDGAPEPKIGTQDYPAGQNGFVDPINPTYGTQFYGTGKGGTVFGRRFVTGVNPLNVLATNCNNSMGPNTNCHPYSIDSVTTLVWKTCSQGQYYYTASNQCMTDGTDFSWGDAVNSCASLNAMNNGQGYGGRRDWRLPTVYELETLVDYGARNTTLLGLLVDAPAIHGYQQGANPFVPEGPFPNTSTNKGFWTSTGISVTLNGQSGRSNAYMVEFRKGHVGNGGPLLNTSRATSNRHKVRCVAGPAVEPPAQNFTQNIVGAGADLTGNAAAFIGPDSNATFNVTGVTPNFNISNSEHSVTVQFNKPPNATQAGTLSNYCIAGPAATACGPSSPTISTALPSGTNAYKLTLGSAMGANTAYKLFVSNIQSASDVWQTATAYNMGAYFIDLSPNPDLVYYVKNGHTSSSIATDLANTDIEPVTAFAMGTGYAQNTRLYVESLKQVVMVQNTGYTSDTAASIATAVQNDINQGKLQVVKNIIDTPPLALTLNRALFNGPAQTARATATPIPPSPAPSTVFNVKSVSAPNLTTVQVNFNRLPNATEAGNLANYCIISATPITWPTDCATATPIAPVTAVSLSGYTATLTTNLTAGTAYTVFVNATGPSKVTYLGSHIVDDTVNKLRWQKCRRGVLDSPTCGDDGVTTNDSDYWNDALNYCDQLNYEQYDDHVMTNPLTDKYRWRAPTINELKSISNRSLFGTVGVSMDTTVFPTPNLLAEDFHSSTSYAKSGPNSGPDTPTYNEAWAFNFFSGFTSISQRDHSELLSALVKPPKKNIRCVRSLP